MKKIFKFMFAFVLCFIGLNFVNADTRPSTITVTEGSSIGNIGDSANVVKTVYKSTTINGVTVPVYCMNHDATNPGSGKALNLVTSGQFSDMNTFAGIAYIIEHPYTGSVAADGYSKAELDYYMTDMAILWYIDRKNGIADDDSSKTYDNLPSALKTAQGAYAPYSTKINAIKALMTSALNNEANYKTATASASFDATKLTFTLSGGNYVSQEVTLTGTNATTYTLTPTTSVSVVSDTFSTNKKVSFKVSVPSSTTGTVTVSASVSRNNKSTYAYQYQTTQVVVLGKVYTTPSSDTKTLSGTISTTPGVPDTPTTTLVKISKKDATGNNELPGATLVIKDENGETVDTWVSTTTPHEITTLIAGKTYTLEETIAPAGYVKATKVTFTVKPAGTVTEVSMVDELEKVPAPDTGTIDIIIVGLSLLTLSGYGFYYCKKKNLFVK